MKKQYIFLLIICFVCFANFKTYSQTDNPCIKKGKILIDIYYGFPNSFGSFIKKDYNNNFNLTAGLRPEYKIENIGPFGGKFEYLLTNNIGIGLNVFYASTVVKWTTTLYNYETTVSRLRFAGTFNWHFITEKKKFDPYFMIHAGYSNNTYDFTQIPIVPDIKANTEKPEIKGLFPFTCRTAIGCRYFLTDKMGVNLEIGLPGILSTVGVSLKF